MSNLVASQIMNYTDISSRANAIEKWVAVADICRCLHNYNGVLEITSALNRSAIYRLKKTWAKVSKQVSNYTDWDSSQKGLLLGERMITQPRELTVEHQITFMMRKLCSLFNLIFLVSFS